MNHTNNITILEDKMGSLLSDCLKQSIEKDTLKHHPIRIAESAKSLLGLNLKNPNIEIINFLNKIPLKKNSDSSFNYDSTGETVSIYELKDAIEESDIKKCKQLVSNLIRLSDGIHILEFLLELSLLFKVIGKICSV